MIARASASIWINRPDGVTDGTRIRAREKNRTVTRTPADKGKRVRARERGKICAVRAALRGDFLVYNNCASARIESRVYCGGIGIVCRCFLESVFDRE